MAKLTKMANLKHDKYGENVPWVSRIFTLDGNRLKVARQQGAWFQEKPE